MLPKSWNIVSSERRDRLRIFGLRVDRAVSPRTGAAYDFYVLESDSWVNVIPILWNTFHPRRAEAALPGKATRTLG